MVDLLNKLEEKEMKHEDGREPGEGDDGASDDE
jgi:hypothetical protein